MNDDLDFSFAGAPARNKTEVSTLQDLTNELIALAAQQNTLYDRVYALEGTALGLQK